MKVKNPWLYAGLPPSATASGYLGPAHKPGPRLRLATIMPAVPFAATLSALLIAAASLSTAPEPALLPTVHSVPMEIVKALPVPELPDTFVPTSIERDMVVDNVLREMWPAIGGAVALSATASAAYAYLQKDMAVQELGEPTVTTLAQAELKERMAAKAKAKAEASTKAKKAAEIKAKEAAEAEAKFKAEAKAKAEANAKAEAKAKAKAKARAKENAKAKAAAAAAARESQKAAAKAVEDTLERAEFAVAASRAAFMKAAEQAAAKTTADVTNSTETEVGKEGKEGTVQLGKVGFKRVGVATPNEDDTGAPATAEAAAATQEKDNEVMADLQQALEGDGMEVPVLTSKTQTKKAIKAIAKSKAKAVSAEEKAPRAKASKPAAKKKQSKKSKFDKAKKK